MVIETTSSQSKGSQKLVQLLQISDYIKNKRHKLLVVARTKPLTRQEIAELKILDEIARKLQQKIQAEVLESCA